MSTDDTDDTDSTDSTDPDDEPELDDGDVVYLVDDEGNETAWGFLGTVTDGEKDYALLSPVEQLEDEESDSLDVALYLYTVSEDGDERFAEIEDDGERARVEALASRFLEDEGHIAGE